MLYGRSAEEILEDLRHSLDVMEAESHLGLDDGFAEKVRRILVRRIERIEAELRASKGPAAVKKANLTRLAS